MNFNKEMALEFDKLGIKYELVKIPKNKKGTYKDYLKLQYNINSHCEENRTMLELSEMYARDGLNCGSNKVKIYKI